MEDEYGNFIRREEQKKDIKKKQNADDNLKAKRQTKSKISTAVKEKCDNIKCWFFEKYDMFKIGGGKPIYLLLVVAIFVLILVGISAYFLLLTHEEQKGAQLSLFFTDDSNISQLNITVQKIEMKEQKGGFKTVFEGSEIVTLQKNNLQSFGLNITQGNYSGVKLWLNKNATASDENGSVFSVSVQTNVFVVNFDEKEISENQSIDILLDFDLMNAVKQTADGKIIFVPLESLESIEAKDSDELSDPSKENKSVVATIRTSQKSQIKQKFAKISGVVNFTQIKNAVVNGEGEINGQKLKATVNTRTDGICATADIPNTKLYINNNLNTTLEKDKTTCVNLSEGNYTVILERGKFGKLTTEVSIKNTSQQNQPNNQINTTKPADAVQCDSCESCSILVGESANSSVNSSIYIEITKDLVATEGCIILKRNNVTIDCGGHKITGNKQGSAIFLRALRNINITNCEIENFNTGITLSGLRSGMISNNKISKNSKRGIYMYLVSGAQVSGNEIFENADGIFAEKAPTNGIGNIFKNNKISNNSRHGLTISDELNYNTVTNNTLTNNGNAGLFIDESGRNSIIGNIICNNANYDIFHISPKGLPSSRTPDSTGNDNTCTKLKRWHDSSKTKDECTKTC